MSVVPLRAAPPEEWKIVSDVPRRPVKVGRPKRYPQIYEVLAAMRPGDSFFCVDNTDRSRERVRNAAKGLGIRVETRRVTESGAHGLRVWRLL